MPGSPGYGLHQAHDSSRQAAKPEHAIEKDTPERRVYAAHELQPRTLDCPQNAKIWFELPHLAMLSARLEEDMSSWLRSIMVIAFNAQRIVATAIMAIKCWKTGRAHMDRSLSQAGWRR
jgi:hypothetical protein